MKLYGPFKMELQVHMTDGVAEAVVTYSLPVGVFPSEQTIREALAKSETETRSQVGDKWRMMNKREFFNMLTSELTGSSEEFALPGGDDWDGSHTPDNR